MAEIRYSYFSDRYKIDTYDNVLETCLWIRDAIKKVMNTNDINIKICFNAGTLSYNCESIDEFKKYAFGKEIALKDIFIISRNASKNSISVFAGSYKIHQNTDQEFVISSDDEVIISNLTKALSQDKITLDNTNAVSYIDNSIHIGDGNTISSSTIGNDNTISDNQIDNSIGNKTQLPQKENLRSKIAWNIIIPITIGVIIAIICTALGLSN